MVVYKLKSIAILVPRFFDYDGLEIFPGGAERYLTDLVRLFLKQGYQVVVFQCGNSPWIRNYQDITVQSLGTSQFKYDAFPELNQKFHEITHSFDYYLYFSLNMCFPYANPNSIAISHGIWWDSTVHSYFRSQEWYNVIEQCLIGPQLIVSVDTNTINWTRSIYPHLASKMLYIPNYVDAGVFQPTVCPDNNLFTVLYPRSLIAARGWKETQYAADILLSKYPDIEFYLVGRGLAKDELAMQEWARQSPRIRYEWLEANEMYKAYQQADLVLIPSKYAEGTSLSALEAMACGKVVIAGCAGGLTDLIINHYNGYLINVNDITLTQKIEEIYLHRNSQGKIKRRARETALAFSKQRWEEEWIKLIRQIYPQY